MVLWALDTDISNSSYGNDSNDLFVFFPGAISYQDLGIGPNVPSRQGPGLHRCKASDTFVTVQTDFFNSQWHFIVVSVNKPSYIF